MTLTLTACLPTIFTAATATTLSSAKDRTFGDTVDDNIISTKLKKEFIARGFKKLYTKITAEVVQHRVLLTGEVESDDDIVSAVDIAWSIAGVKEVINELKISEDSNKFDTVQYAKDSWISSRIKTSIFFNRSIKFVNYTVVTQKNIVYLFGIARSEEELQNVTKIASEVAGVEKVVSHMHLREEVNKVETSAELDENTIKTKKIDDF